MGEQPGKEIPKDYRRAVRRLVTHQGWRYRCGKHPILYPADPTYDPIPLPATSSDVRGWRNAVAAIRRAGGEM